MRQYFTQAFALKSRSEWEQVFIGTDACTVPILTRDEAALHGIYPAVPKQRVEEDAETIVPRVAPTLSRTPARIAPGSELDQEGEGYEPILMCGEHTQEVLQDWCGLGEKEAQKLAKVKAIGGGDLDELHPIKVKL